MKFLTAALLLIVFSYFRISYAFKYQPKIVDGYVAQRGHFPFYVFLNIFLNQDQSKGCGATIISDEWLITAAHCVRKADGLTAHFGISNLNDFFKHGHDSISVPKSNFYMHGKYFRPIAWNDIGEFY